MKKLLLLFMLSFIIASRAMFGQTKYCENVDIPLSNYQSSAEADWSNEDEPYYVGYNQEVVYQNHARYIISNGVISASLDYIYPGSYFNMDALFNNSITFSANG